ncbi:MAG: hypothetical protein ABFD89_03845 [Bryobacteraceae bacterium]
MTAISLAGLTSPGVGVSAPKWEQVTNRVLMLQVSPADIPRTVTPADINGVAAALIAGGATSPWWLEEIGRRVTTYPYTRSETDVLGVQ